MSEASSPHLSWNQFHYLHPFASLITVLMNSLKELSYESLETQCDRYMGYLLTTGKETKAHHVHQNLKIISVSLYATTLEIQDDPDFMYSSSLKSEIQCFKKPSYLQTDCSSLQDNSLCSKCFFFLFTERLIDDFQANQKQPRLFLIKST